MDIKHQLNQQNITQMRLRLGNEYSNVSTSGYLWNDNVHKYTYMYDVI